MYAMYTMKSKCTISLTDSIWLHAHEIKTYTVNYMYAFLCRFVPIPKRWSNTKRIPHKYTRANQANSMKLSWTHDSQYIHINKSVFSTMVFKNVTLAANQACRVGYTQMILCVSLALLG